MNATLAKMKSDKANDNVLNEVIEIIEKRAISGEYNVSVNINIKHRYDIVNKLIKLGYKVKICPMQYSLNGKY